MTEPVPPERPEPRPVPDLGFFSGPPSKGGQPFGAAPAAPASPGFRAAYRPAPPGFATSAAPTAPPAQPTSPPASLTLPPVYPTSLPGYPTAPPPQTGLPAWAIVALCVPVVFIVIAILAAVAIPTFLNQREEAIAAKTTVTLPETVEGLERLRTAEAEAVIEAQVAALPTDLFRDTKGAAYTDGVDRTVFVQVARFTRLATPQDLDDAITGFQEGATSDLPPGVGASAFQERPSGALGGRINCATLTGATSGQMCIAVESSTVVALVDIAPARPVDPDLTRRVREAVVRQTSGS